MNFKEWFIFNESKEEKELAKQLAGNDETLTSLSEIIPKGKKETDPLLLLAAYYYNKNSDLQQIKNDMKDYIVLLNNNRMPLIKVDLISKEPPNPWKDYLHFTQIIHGHQGEDAAKQKAAYKPSDIDFQNEKPIEISKDGKIKVYAAKNTQQCIILGKGQSFCISQPGNRMWQSYRNTKTSTFYFVYDDTRDDRLSIVVVDVNQNGIELTDKVNKTGTTLDPYTNKLTTNSSSYIKYLKEKGIDVSKFVNSPKTDEEIEEDKKLGNPNESLDWFKSLSPEEKSNYIGRGHRLTDEQFDFLWDNKFNSLLTQYVKTGLTLDDYQLDKIASNRDLKDNYLHNRLIADQQDTSIFRGLRPKEFSLLKDADKQKIKNSSTENLCRYGDFDEIKNFIQNKPELTDDDISGLTTGYCLRKIPTSMNANEFVKLIIQHKKELTSRNVHQLLSFPHNADKVKTYEILGSANISKLKYMSINFLITQQYTQQERNAIASMINQYHKKQDSDIRATLKPYLPQEPTFLSRLFGFGNKP